LSSLQNTQGLHSQHRNHSLAECDFNQLNQLDPKVGLGWKVSTVGEVKLDWVGARSTRIGVGWKGFNLEGGYVGLGWKGSTVREAKLDWVGA
jgi:hypothetical protein